MRAAWTLLVLLLLAPSAAARASFDLTLEDPAGDVLDRYDRPASRPEVDILSFSSREENGTIEQRVRFDGVFAAPNDSLYVATMFKDSLGTEAYYMEIVLDGMAEPQDRLRARLRDGAAGNVTPVEVRYAVRGAEVFFLFDASHFPEDATCFHPVVQSDYASRGASSRDPSTLPATDRLEADPPLCARPGVEAWGNTTSDVPEIDVPQMGFPRAPPAPGSGQPAPGDALPAPGPPTWALVGLVALAAATWRRK